jgi:hypothetical protein
MENKHNIEELKHLLPDLITGQISDEDKLLLESAIENSTELRADYAELKSTFDIVESVKNVEPPPEYWNNLLPRIHQRIEEKEAASFNWDKIASVWKVLVPIAAVILIAVIYYLAVPSKNELTDKEKIEKIAKDTSRVDSKKDTKLPEITNDDKNTDDIKKNIENEKNNMIRKFNRTGNDIVKDNMKINAEENKEANQPNEINDQLTDVPLESDDIEDTSIFAEGEASGLGEDIENELSKLDDHEKSSLLEQLENNNL